MTINVLANRLQRAESTVIQYETSEQRGTITLNTLRQVAAAMDCQLVYALVPNCSLNVFVTHEATQRAKAQLMSVEQTMVLEAQGLDAEQQQEMLADMVRELKTNSKEIWS